MNSNQQISIVKYGCLFILVCFCLTAVLHACSVPVFRYALERWPVDAYRLAVFHEGSLSPTQQALQQHLESISEIGYGYPPLVLQAVDTNEPVPEILDALWKENKEQTLPLMVLIPPMGGGDDVAVWKAPLTKENVNLLLGSPSRRALEERLIDGETAVWLLLRSGDDQKDDALIEKLEEGLKEMEDNLKLPHQLDPYDTEYDTAMSEEIELKIDFSVLPVDLDDPCEALLSAFFEDIVTNEEGERMLPAVVPVFGRARALVVLDEADIVLDSIAEICHFLVGPCSCQVKQMNPGVDLPVFLDWDARIVGMMGDEEIPTELIVPVAEPVEETNSVEPKVAEIESPSDSQLETQLVAIPEPAPESSEPNSPVVASVPSTSLNRHLLLVALIGLAVVGMGTGLVLKKSK